jgi:hypothetical protein
MIQYKTAIQKVITSYLMTRFFFLFLFKTLVLFIYFFNNTILREYF